MRRWMAGLAAGVTVATLAGYRLVYGPWRRRWYASSGEAGRPLPGDELVPDPDFDETMAVTIDAPTSAVWPWLVQLGYGRGGWYSYDAIDMLGHSTRAIIPGLQDLEVGQVVPFAPEMGFGVKVLEPERALVLYADDELVAQQERAAGQPGHESSEGEPGAGLRLAGALSQANMRAFMVSWAFVLEPLDGQRTRLLERFRTRSTPGPATAIVRPLIDHGHFLMTRKQLLGIKERAEAIAAVGGAAPHPAGAVTAGAS